MTDPVEVFPSEILSPFFSLFNNQELQILSSISRSWRRRILTDVIIHRVLDLTEIKRNLSEDETIDLVKRLAGLSSYPRNEIHLLLQPFWKTFEKLLNSDTTSDQWPEQMKASFNKFGSLLSAIASSTEGKLSGLHLSLGSSQVPKGGSAGIFASAILERVFTLAKLMKELDSISFKVPLPISLDSEGENGSKRFRIIGDENDGGEASWRFVPFTALIRRTIDFTGFGLTQLGIDFDRFPCLPTGEIDFDAIEKIFKHVEASSFVMRDLTCYGLESDDVSQLALDIVSKCPNLSSLSLLMKGDSNQQKQLVFPKHSSTSSLVNLNVTMYSLGIDWSSSLLLEWIGSRLKTFWIDHGGSTAQFPVEALKSILNQNPLLEVVSIQASNISTSSIKNTTIPLNLPNLKELTLGSFDHVQELVSGASQNQKSLGEGSFPSLSVIELGEGSDCIWEFFAQASFGNLKTLVVSNVNLFSGGDHELSSMQDIIGIIISNSSSLVKVGIEDVVDETREELKGSGKGKGKKQKSAKTSELESKSLEPLSFPSLTSFSIKSISAAQFSTFYTFVSFFAQLQYPVLINLEVSGEGSAKERASLAQMMKVFKSNASLVGKGIRQE